MFKTSANFEITVTMHNKIDNETCCLPMIVCMRL